MEKTKLVLVQDNTRKSLMRQKSLAYSSQEDGGPHHDNAQLVSEIVHS